MYSRPSWYAMSLGDLQAEIMGALQKLGKASARDVREEIGANRQVAYTTISTVLNRLHRKGLVKRSKVNSRGGTKYVYSYAAPADVRSTFVQSALSHLVSAFGPSIVPTIYASLENLTKEETDELRKKVVKTRK